MKRLVLVVCVGVLLPAVWSGAAQAASPPISVNTQSVRGFIGGTPPTIDVSCPQGTLVVGGGFDTGNTDSYGILASVPLNTTTWELRFALINDPNSDDVTTGYAVCASPALFPGGVAAFAKGTSIPGIFQSGSSTGTANSVCGYGYIPISGGFDLDDLNVALDASLPYFTAEAGNGWSVTAFNGDKFNAHVITSYAVCTPASSAPTIDFDTNTTHEDTDTWRATCDQGVAIGGGVQFPNANLLSGDSLVSSLPALFNAAQEPGAWRFVDDTDKVQTTVVACIGVSACYRGITRVAQLTGWSGEILARLGRICALYRDR
jgi:hypothetical protein